MYSNSGIFLYELKYSFHVSLVNGGKKPLKNSHSVIDRPESVNLVKPPIMIIEKTNIKVNKNLITKYFTNLKDNVEKSNEFVEYLNNFYEFCFDKSPNSVLEEIKNYKF